LGPDHQNVAGGLNNIAELHRVQGQYKQAEPLYQRALAILEKTLGPNNPNVAQVLDNLAELYRKTGRVKDAAALSKRAAEIRAPQHPGQH
ncbi:MAG: tetratricopeptide repeat protein, partial [Gammaproteobacteria bacterium]|nr:tetratricopeptide repeat protein [Gammaproteobacteria bacterium]